MLRKEKKEDGVPLEESQKFELRNWRGGGSEEGETRPKEFARPGGDSQHPLLNTRGDFIRLSL